MGRSATRGPGALEKAWIVARELVYCTWLLLTSAVPFISDLVRTNFVQRRDERLPGNIGELLEPKVFGRLAGRAVESVRYSEQLEQHANSTDRAWLIVKYADEDEEVPVFAKVHARTFLVRSLMSMFDVYRNELDTYATVEMPVLTPAVHIAQWTPSRFCLAMEDLRAREVTFPNLWETKVDMALAKQVLSTLARIHAKFWGNVPAGAWNDATRPYKAKVMGLATLFQINRVCPGLITPDVQRAFTLAVWNWEKLRAFWSRPGAKTMVHGDAHMGNFFITKDGTVGTFDFQVKAEEHPMRDVTYFLCSSFPREELAACEKELIKHHLAELVAHGVPSDKVPAFEECWLQYRLHPFYAMYAFVFSGGFSDLMDPVQTRYGLERIVAQMERVDSAGALNDLLDGKI